MLRPAKIAALAVLWLVPTLIFAAAFSSGWIPAWHSVGVPAILPRFADLATIPYGVQALHRGLDPLISSPTDPLHRTVNYPRIWLYLFSALGITPENVWAVALVFCALYLICMTLLIARAAHPGDVFVLLVASLSTVPLLAMELGNNDLFIFSVIFLGCFTTNRYLKSFAFSTGSLLKIFPIFGMGMDAIRRPGRQRFITVVSTLLVGGLLALQWHDISLIRAGTPMSRTGSFGVLPLRWEVLHFFPERIVYYIQLPWLIAGAFWFIVIAIFDFVWKRSLDIDLALFRSPEGEMFSIFSAIYVATYAVGSNWDYRLIFLLPTLPFALRVLRMAPKFRIWAIAFLVLVGIAENALRFGVPGNPLRMESHGGTLLAHLATFQLFLLLLTVLAFQLKSIVVTEFLPSSRTVADVSLTENQVTQTTVV
jgi:hypothetical protein